MDNQCCTVENLTAHLDRLERENRRLKLAGAILLLALAAVGTMGQVLPKAVATVVEAERFVLRDTRGKLRAVLGLQPDGSPGLYLFDQNEKARARLVLLPPDGKPALALADQNGKFRARLSLQPVGGPALALADHNEKTRALLSLQPDGGPALDLFDQNEKPRAVLGQTALETKATGTVEQRPASSLVLLDRDGKVVWRVP